jgi:uncharacterized RDD family membrane protein YckC
MRNIVRLLAVIWMIPAICYFAIALTQRKQGLHDLWASTYVLNGTVQSRPPQQPRDGRGHHFNA